jgi:predicted O-methyltransferase YrrM
VRKLKFKSWKRLLTVLYQFVDQKFLRLKFMNSSISFKLMEYIHPKDKTKNWGIIPLNGQYVRMQQIVHISQELSPTHVIETGTYFAGSTGFLSSLTQGTCFSIEVDPRIHKIAEENILANFGNQNIHLIQGSSDTEIEHVLALLSESARVLAYLDAHWYENMPLQRELIALSSWGGVWVAVIDDFKVPGDVGYGFDKYGQVEIGPQIIPSEIFNCGAKVYVPKTPSDEETGKRRGTGYVFSLKSLKLMKNFSFENLKEIRVD